MKHALIRTSFVPDHLYNAHKPSRPDAAGYSKPHYDAMTLAFFTLAGFSASARRYVATQPGFRCRRGISRHDEYSLL